MNVQAPNVSVVIPSYNEASYIGRLLESLTKQNYPDFDVIVSDAQSRDGIEKVVADYEDKLSITSVSSPPEGPGAGRNIGATKARGEWLLFLDADDTIDDPDFITKLVRGAISNGWQTASAKYKHEDASWIEEIARRFNHRYLKFLSCTKHPVAPGWCILTRRSIFERHKGFNPKIQFGEDYDYVSRVGKYGFGIVETTYYYVDLRRAREEGWRLTYKAIANEIYRHTHQYNLEKNPYKYEFGKHKTRD
ncbi:MAG TPA: glycosyltransferase [Candidatus Saccharimonadales bacterium]|nr:glycosyltransferase [Candidatus Saccharimonadales bacterium]